MSQNAPSSYVATPHSTCPLCGGKGHHDFIGRDLMYNRPEPYEYHRCAHCGVIYQQPLPPPEIIAEFYPDDYSIYHPPSEREKRFGKWEKALLAWKHGYRQLAVPPLQRLLAPLRAFTQPPLPIDHVPGGRVLDIGCGNGQLLLRLQDLGWRCQGVEFNARAVEICRANGLEVFHGELEAAALPDAAFDLVTAHHLIEHVRDPDRLLAEIARVLKPGGHLWLRTPNNRALGRSLFGPWWFPNETPRHLFLFSALSLNRLAKRHGLRTLMVRSVVKEKHVLNSLDYRLGNKGRPSRKRKLRKWLAKLYILPASLPGRGDELSILYEKGKGPVQEDAAMGMRPTGS